MLIVIDFYAENPIVGKTLQLCHYVDGTLNNNVITNTYLSNGNTYKTITGDGVNTLLIDSANKLLRLQSINANVEVITNQYYDITADSRREVVNVETSTRTPNYYVYNPNFNGTVQFDSNFIALGQPINGYSVPTDNQTLVEIRTVSNTNDAQLSITNTVNNAVTFAFENIANNASVIFSVGGSVILPDVSKVKISGGLSNQILTTDGAGNLSWTTPSSGGLTTSNFVFNEIPVGLINNVNLNYTLAFTPQANTVQVFVNGLLQKPTTDYTISGSTLSFITPLRTGDELLVHYIK